MVVLHHSGREKWNGKERRKKSGDRSQLVKNPAGQFGGNELRAGWKEERLRKRMRLGVEKKGLSRRLGWESRGSDNKKKPHKTLQIYNDSNLGMNFGNYSYI